MAPYHPTEMAQRSSKLRRSIETDQLPRLLAESVKIYYDKLMTSLKFNALVAYLVLFGVVELYGKKKKVSS